MVIRPVFHIVRYMKYNYTYCFVARYLSNSILVRRSCKSRVRSVRCKTKWNLSNIFWDRLCYFLCCVT